MDTDFFELTGKMAIGSRLRMLTDCITEDAAKIYELYGVDLKVKWFPVFFVLSSGDSKSITTIAKEIGHSHPSVSKIVKEMSKAGLIKECVNETDRRKNVVLLSEKGIQIAHKLEDQYTDINSAIESISKQSKYDLWEAIGEWEILLSQKTLLQRVKEEKKKRESKYVEIINYREEYQPVFRRLNEQWIKAYFEIEEADCKALENTDQIIQNGGYIFVALYKGEAVGVCALIRIDGAEYDFEFAKMAVDPNVQGRNIGFLLGKAAINKARDLAASSIYLESNTDLKPAISLYKKLGFKKIVGHATPYKRCNIQMVLDL